MQHVPPRDGRGRRDVEGRHGSRLRRYLEGFRGQRQRSRRKPTSFVAHRDRCIVSQRRPAVDVPGASDVLDRDEISLDRRCAGGAKESRHIRDSGDIRWILDAVSEDRECQSSRARSLRAIASARAS